MAAMFGMANASAEISTSLREMIADATKLVAPDAGADALERSRASARRFYELIGDRPMLPQASP
eukprot:257570-Prymnesium_polylepis.1